MTKIRHTQRFAPALVTPVSVWRLLLPFLTIDQCFCRRPRHAYDDDQDVGDRDATLLSLEVRYLSSYRSWPVNHIHSSSAANVFFNLRFPTVGFSSYIPLLLCYPLGKFAASVLPITTFRVFLPRP